MSEPEATPPSRQLFVRFPSRLPRSPREVEDIFAREGQVKHLKLSNSRQHAFVHYWRTPDAIEAKKKLDGTSPLGITLSIDYNKPSRLLRLDCPASFSSAEQVIAMMPDTFPRYEWIDFLPDKKVVYVFMASLEEAIESVRKLQMTLIGEWRLEIEFHKETSYKASRYAITRTTSPPAAATVVATTPVAPLPPVAVTSTLPASVEDAERSKKEDGSARSQSKKNRDRSRSPSPKRSRGRSPQRRSPSSSSSSSPSPSPSPSPSSSRSRSPTPPPHGSTKKRKEKETAREERKKRKEKKKDTSRRSSSSSRRRCHHRSASPPSSPSFSSASEDSSSSSSSSNSALFPYACSQCNKLFDHLHADHKLSEDYVTKKLIKAWFHGNFKLLRGDGRHENSGRYKTSLSIRRQPFLKGYINPFLRSVGLPEWSSRSPMYTDWFLGRVLRLAPAQLNSTLPWRFHRFTTRENFEEILRRLLDNKE